jgi:hypothetical protein
MTRNARDDWDEVDSNARDKALHAAEAELTSDTEFRIEEFCWTGTGLNDLNKSDQIVQVLESGRRKYVHPVGRVLTVKRYRVRDSRRAIVFIEIAKRHRQKRIASVLRQLGDAPKRFRRLSSPWLVMDWSFAHRLLNLWGSNRA